MADRKRHIRPGPATGTLVGLAVAGAFFGFLAMLGHRYTSDCVRRGGDMDRCWDKGLEIAGIGPGRPLSAAAVLGYIIGTLNKEQEKQEKFNEGYWTLNPELRETTKNHENT